MKTTPQDRAIMALIRDGADVFSPDIARQIRDLQQRRPKLLEITEPMGVYGPRDVHPYLGAILTAAGRKVLDTPARPARQREDDETAHFRCEV